MGFEEFAERVRVGVIAGAFTVKDAVDYLTTRGWHTTRDVPVEYRSTMLEDLTKC